MKQPTEEIYKAAIARLENGFSLGDVIRYFGQHPLEYDIPKTTLHRRWDKHRNSKSGTPEQSGGTGGTISIPNELKAVEAETQNAVLNTDNAVSEHSERAKQRSETSGTVAFFQRHFSRMDVAFYITSGTACFSFWVLAPGVVGGVFALVYGLLSFDALQKIKDDEMPETAEAAQTRAWIVELVAAVAHFNLFYKTLLANPKMLPFSVMEKATNDIPVTLNGVLQNGYIEGAENVAYVSAGLAALFLFAAIEAINSTLKATKERKLNSKKA